MLNQLQYTYKTGRWWDDIRGKRQQLGRLFRWKRSGGASQAAVREARRALRRSIRRARRQCWEDSLSKAYGEDVWKISGYIPPERPRQYLPSPIRAGQTQRTMIRPGCWPTSLYPHRCPMRATRARRGLRARLIGRRSFLGTSSKKSPGPDGIGPLAFRCLFMEWDAQRVVALIRTHIRLGVHPARWKLARGVVIPKPGKDDCSAVKAYRCILLPNCLGKIVEKVAADLISSHCEARGGFHPGQYGCRAKRSAVDAVGVAIAQVQEVWKRGVIAGAILMDVAAAFPSVARGCLLRKMRRAGVDECLVRWTDSFMRDRRVIMSVDGQDGQEMGVSTGLPQGSPVSPVLFALYIAEIHQAVESQVEDCRGISFVDDEATRIVEGYDVEEVAGKLERCAATSLAWAENNAVRFETSKTEAILFSRRRKHRRCQRGIRVVLQIAVVTPSQVKRWIRLGYVI